MRILHTADWHLGQHFMGKSRQAEHQALIEWLLLQVEEHAGPQKDRHPFALHDESALRSNWLATEQFFEH